MRSESLHGERGLGFGAVPREALADQAQLERRDLAAEHSFEQAVEGADQRPVDAAGLPAVGQRRKGVAGELLCVAQQSEVLVGEVDVGGYAITAVATSSTRAASSNSALTPSSAIAG
jgi:hypothetical protein